VLTHRWRIPSLSLHGVEHAYSGPGVKTVIPARAIGKFSIRVVPHMDIDTTVRAVRAHIDAKFAAMGTPNEYEVRLMTYRLVWWATGCTRSVSVTSIAVQLTVGHGAPAWVADFDNTNFVAGRTATRNVRASCLLLGWPS